MEVTVNGNWQVADMDPGEIREHILVDPLVCHGQPCIRGTRIQVWLVLEALAGGDTIDDLLANYPGLTAPDIRACLAYGASLASEVPTITVESAVDRTPGGEPHMKLEFTAVFEQVPEGFIGYVEELPGANTQGPTLDETRANLVEAVELVLEANRTLTEERLGSRKVIREPLSLTT